MAITYTWDCRTVDVYPTHSDAQDPVNTENDVIYNIHWRVTGVESSGGVDYTATSIGTQTIETTNLSSFDPFADVDNTEVVGWCQSAMVAAYSSSVENIENSISASIADQITPTSVTMEVKAG